MTNPFHTHHQSRQNRLFKGLLLFMFMLSISVGCTQLQPIPEPPRNQEVPAPPPTQPVPTPAQPETKPAPPAPNTTPLDATEARKLLSELGYWVNIDASAKSDSSLHHAMMAFQKVEGRKRTGKLTAEEAQVLRTAKRPTPRQTGFPHVEVDITRQVLFAVELGGVPLRILPVSTGSGKWYVEKEKRQRAVTPTGEFKVERKIKGRRKSDLGLLYDPCYIYRGIAIHGNPSVPPKPASHGCIRIPMFASKEFSALTEVGTVVMVY